MAQTTVAPPNKEVADLGDKPMRESVRKPMTKRVRKRAKRLRVGGMISDKAAKRHLGEE
jgi:hypothetical protein